MKKLLVLLLTLILSVSVASCGCSKKDKKTEVPSVENKQEETVKEVDKNKVIETKETSDTKESAKEIFTNYKGKEPGSANMYNLFKLLNIVDINDTALKVNVENGELVYRIINNEKYFDVSPVAYAKVSAAIFAIYPDITKIRYEMEYLGNDYNIFYFDAISDVATYLGDDYYNAQTFAKARESEDALKNFLGKLDKIKVPQVSLDEKVENCFKYNEWADYKYTQYDKKVKKFSFILPENTELPPEIGNLYFENDEDIFEGFRGKPVEVIMLNIKQVNIETPVNYYFLFSGDKIIWFGNVDGHEDLALEVIRNGLTEDLLERYKALYQVEE